MCWNSIWHLTRLRISEAILNDGLGILLALLAVIAPLFVAWYLCSSRYEARCGSSNSHKRIP
jgi:hypothetical protein